MARLAGDTASPSTADVSLRSRTGRSRRRLDLNLVLPAVLLASIGLACLVGPLVGGLPHPNVQNLVDARLGVGTPGHPLGTDALGRDMLARLLYGGRISLLVGFGAVALGFLVGGSFGLVAGYAGKYTDAVVSRVVEVLMAFPALVLALAIATYLGPSVRNVTLAIGFFTVPLYFRLARAGAIALRDRELVVAAQLAGARSGYILIRHVAPLVAQSLLAYSMLAVGASIMVESGLSFLGLGVQPPQATWGVMIADGRAELVAAPHIVFVPAACLLLTIVSLNLLGDAITARTQRKSGAA